MTAQPKHSAKGIFAATSSRGLNFGSKRRKGDTLDRFAEELSKHSTPEDVAAGTALVVDEGGNAGECAVRIGLKRASGNGLLQRIRQRLGPQAV